MIELGKPEQRILGDVKQVCHLVKRRLAEMREHGLMLASASSSKASSRPGGTASQGRMLGSGRRRGGAKKPKQNSTTGIPSVRAARIAVGAWSASTACAPVTRNSSRQATTRPSRSALRA